MQGMTSSPGKAVLRSQLLARRSARSGDEILAARQAITSHLLDFLCGSAPMSASSPQQTARTSTVTSVDTHSELPAQSAATQSSSPAVHTPPTGPADYTGPADHTGPADPADPAAPTDTATTLCAYWPLPTEPLGDDVPAAFAARGWRVLLPVAEVGAPLNWVEPWARTSDASRHPARQWRRSSLGVREPAGTRLGPATIQAARMVLVPALAIDRHGFRLGRGGGYYDRSLALAGHDVILIGVIFDDELLADVPHDAHDLPVTHLVTPLTGVQASVRGL